MRYAGFWPRLGALLLDVIAMSPLIALNYWALSGSRWTTLLVYLCTSTIAAIYPIYFVGRWGQTLGKMAVNIRVFALDGTDAGFRRAIYRSSVDVALGIAGTALAVVGFLAVTDEAYDALSTGERLVIFAGTPSLSMLDKTLTVLSHIWALSELIVLLLNEKRRALHDFIAGTVVAHVEEDAVEA